MTPPDDRRVPRAATAPRSGDAAPLVASLPPVYRYLILFNAVLSAASLAFAIAAITRGNAAAGAGVPARPSVSGCLTPGRDEMPQLPAHHPQPADTAPAAHPAGAVPGCRPQLI